MNKPGKVVKNMDQLIREKKAQRRLKADKFMAKLEKLEKAKEQKKEVVSKIAVPLSKKPQYTLSIALPCSILESCQTFELKCYVASMIARCAALYGIDELVVYNDTTTVIPITPTGEYALMGRHSHPAITLGGILQYMECPPYMRNTLFPHKREYDLAYQMNPLNLPHHDANFTEFREGVVSSKIQPKPGQGSFVDVGLAREVQVDRLLEEGVRVTVKMLPAKANQKRLKGIIVSPSTPRAETSTYWGYSVRLAKNFSEVFNNSPYKMKYDLTIGANGMIFDDIKLEPFQHGLLVFGGQRGLEAIIEAEEGLATSDPNEVFDFYINSCPQLGSKTIRTEEALFICLAVLQGKFPQ